MIAYIGYSRCFYRFLPVNHRNFFFVATVLFGVHFYIYSVNFIKFGALLISDSQYRLLSVFLPILAGKSSEFILFMVIVESAMYFYIYSASFDKIGVLLLRDS